MAKGKEVEVEGKGKKKCPLSKKDFVAKAKPLVVKIGETGVMTAAVKGFATGSFGWYAGGKVTIEVDGVPVEVQVGLNMTAIGSKPE